VSYDRHNVQKKTTRLTTLFGGALVVAVFLAIVLVLMSVTIVEPGTVGVVVRWGQVYDVFHPGLHFRIPVADSIVNLRTVRLTYETSDQPGESMADYTDPPVDTSSSDGQRVDIRYTIRFHLDSAKAKWIIQNYNAEKYLVERVVKADSRSFARNTGREYTAIQLYSGDVFAYQRALAEVLAPIFEENGMILDEVLVRSIGFDDNYIQAVEQKQIAQEMVKTRKHEAEQAEEEARRMENLAYGEAQAAIEKARGEAEAVRLRADAEAYSIELKGRALDKHPILLQLEMINSLRDPDSRFRLLVLPESGILSLLNLGEEALLEE